MSDPVSPPLSWVCPECARRVPSKVASCRCGYAPAAPPDAAGLPAAPAASEASSERPAVSPIVKAVAIMAVVALAVFAWAMRPGDSSSGVEAVAVPASVPAARLPPPQETASASELPAMPMRSSGGVCEFTCL